ncbi:MAG: FAD-binding oxidoreductase [Gammaproteobacteria bacterium]|mgnify:FL=1|nr:FAD-binding oxidoreductase [Gammaproteobacteria bacterium]MDG2434222.1 FAD-binding oxidoreductase [Gammaproteobacteria bacterium]
MSSVEIAFNQISDIVGKDNFIQDEHTLSFYSTDVFVSSIEKPLAVVRPNDSNELIKVVKTCIANDVSIIVRGGGASYTGGYLPINNNTIIVDSQNLKKIEINEEDMFVTVEPGVTWLELYEALNPLGLRTPFWGPFSGRVATIAGSMSYHALSHGTNNAVSADSLSSLQVIIGNGEVIETGSQGDNDNSSRFFRHYGPDTGGLFLGDSGALGIKTKITLKLKKKPSGFAAISFGFPDFKNLFLAMRDISKIGIVSDNHGLDPRKQKTAIMEMENANPLMAAKSVFLSSKNPIDGLLQIVKMGFAGRGFLKHAAFSGHFTTEGINNKEAKIKIAEARRIAQKYGKEVANSIPVYLHANPFMELTPILGPNGERWKPTHGVLPFSKVLKHDNDFESLMLEYKDRMKEHGVAMNRMFSFIDSNAFLYEPTFLWKDEQTIYHKNVYPLNLDDVPVHEPNPQGMELVYEIKQRIEDMCINNGAIHFQIGKDYPYLKTRTKETRNFLCTLKKQLDPKNLINPGALGFDEII